MTVPYAGVKSGRTLEWFVPTLFKGRWIASGWRLLREIPDEYLDDVPVPMSQARRKQLESVAVAPPVAPPSADGAITTDESPKRKRR